MSGGAVEVVNLENYSTPEELAKGIKHALTTVGFLFITGHGLEEHVDRMFDISENFFKNETEEEKLRCGYVHKTATVGNKGYTRVAQEVLDPTLNPEGDAKEGFNTGVISRGPPPVPTQPLPKLLADHVEQLAEFQHDCFMFCQRLLEAFAIALDLDPETFTSQHKDGLDSVSILRFLHYPQIREGVQVSPNRAGAHSDYGSLTLLFQKNDGGAEGLQILPPTESLDGGKWQDVGVVEGALLVNIGDALEYWSGSRFKSTLHRVRLPSPIPAKGVPERFSIAYFNQPSPNAILKCVVEKEQISNFDLERMERKGIKTGTIMTSNEHLQARLGATYKQAA